MRMYSRFMFKPDPDLLTNISQVTALALQQVQAKISEMVSGKACKAICMANMRCKMVTDRHKLFQNDFYWVIDADLHYFRIAIGAKMITCRKICFEQLIFELQHITAHLLSFARINFRL